MLVKVQQGCKPGRTLTVIFILFSILIGFLICLRIALVQLAKFQYRRRR